MKKVILIVLASTSIFFVGCKSKSKATTSSDATSASNATTNADGSITLKCRVSVSFISFASGIDGPKFDLIKDYIDKHPKKPAYDLIPMGREGETDICLSLKEMNSSEQKDFIKELNKLAEGADRVKVMENQERVKRERKL